jgi:hypothetical protein
MKGDSGPPGVKGNDFRAISDLKLLFNKGERGDSVVGSKGDRGAPGLPGRYSK